MEYAKLILGFFRHPSIHLFYNAWCTYSICLSISLSIFPSFQNKTSKVLSSVQQNIYRIKWRTGKTGLLIKYLICLVQGCGQERLCGPNKDLDIGSVETGSDRQKSNPHRERCQPTSPLPRPPLQGSPAKYTGTICHYYYVNHQGTIIVIVSSTSSISIF